MAADVDRKNRVGQDSTFGATPPDFLSTPGSPEGHFKAQRLSPMEHDTVHVGISWSDGSFDTGHWFLDARHHGFSLGELCADIRRGYLAEALFFKTMYKYPFQLEQYAGTPPGKLLLREFADTATRWCARRIQDKLERDFTVSYSIQAWTSTCAALAPNTWTLPSRVGLPVAVESR